MTKRWNSRERYDDDFLKREARVCVATFISLFFWLLPFFTSLERGQIDAYITHLLLSYVFFYFFLL